MFRFHSKYNILFTTFLVLVIIEHTNAQSDLELESSNLPLVYIETNGVQIKDEPKIVAHMGIINNGENERNFPSDPFNHYDGYIGIEIRGSSSQMFPKKQYSVETWDAEGNNINISLFGMPSENDWILYAPYSDKTLMRNVLAYHLSSQLGRYAPRTKFVELFLNGDYRGVYVFMEKIKKDDGRVNISTLKSDDVEGDELTGGYLLQIDRNEDNGWYSDIPPYEGSSEKIYYQLLYPDIEDVQPEQYQYIRSYINNFEIFLQGSDFNIPNSGYHTLLDVYSMIDFVIVNELAKNIDAYRLSTFFYKDKNSKDKKIHLGPVWDFNIAFGNANYYRGSNHENWHIKQSFPDLYQPPFWFKKIFDDGLFFNMMSARWFELRGNILSTDYILSFIDSTAKQLDEARLRNFQRWDILGTYVWPNPEVFVTYQEEINYLRRWITDRASWMDNNLIDNYSKVYWNSPGDLISEHKTGQTKSFSNDNFYSGLKEIDFTIFYSLDSNLTITTPELNKFQLYSDKDGTYKFIGIGYKNGNTVDVSPEYTMTFSETTDIEEETIPQLFHLYQNYPNPFNPSTTLKFTIPNVGTSRDLSLQTRLVIYDALGRKVATMVNETKTPGTYEVTFNVGTTHELSLPSGVYFYKLTSGKFSQTKKMLLLK